MLTRRGWLPWQESYLSVSLNLPSGIPLSQQQLMSLDRMQMAASSIADADVVGTRIAKEQQWSLAPLHGTLACIAPGFYAQGYLGRLGFPSWLGRNSSSMKRQRQLRECTAHMQAKISGSKDEVRQSYMTALRAPLLRPLLTQGTDGTAEVLEFMDSYSLAKDDFDAIMEMQLLGPNAKADITQVPANVKAALTRKYNQAHSGFVKKTSSTGNKVSKERFTEGSENDDGGSSEDEVEEGREAVQVKPAASHRAKVGKGNSKANI
jgi:replication factor C subunit 1